MKKLVSVLLLVLIFVCLAACGGTEAVRSAPAATDAPVSAKTPFDFSGCWSCDGILSGDEQLDAGEVESAAGMDAAYTLSFELLDDFAVVTYMGNSMRCAYECTDSTLTLTSDLGDGFTFTFTPEEDGRLSFAGGDLGTLCLSRVDERPEALSSQLHCYFLPDYTREESSALANFMAQGLYTTDGSSFFGIMCERSSSRFGLCSLSLSVDEYGIPLVSEGKLLSARSAPQYLNVDSDHIYYLNRGATDGSDYSLCRIGKDGTDPLVIADDAYSYVQLVGSKLFYCDDDYRYRSVNLDGSGEELVFDKEIYYAYQVKPGLLMYQDDADSESLHLRDLETGADMRIAMGRVYDYGIIGNYLYFAKINEAAEIYDEDICSLYRMDLTRPCLEYSDDGELLFAYSYERSDKNIDDLIFAYPDMLYARNFAQASPDEWLSLSLEPDYVLRFSVLYRDDDWLIYANRSAKNSDIISIINFCSIESGSVVSYLDVEDIE